MPSTYLKRWDNDYFLSLASRFSVSSDTEDSDLNGVGSKQRRRRNNFDSVKIVDEAESRDSQIEAFLDQVYSLTVNNSFKCSNKCASIVLNENCYLCNIKRYTCHKIDRRWDSGRNDEFSVSRTRKQRLLQQQTREVEYWVDKYVWGGGQNLWRDDQANTVHGGPIPGQNHSWHPLQKRSGRGRKRNRPTTGRLPDHRSSKVLAQNIKY